VWSWRNPLAQPRKVLVCGGREGVDEIIVWAVLAYKHAAHPFSLVIHGGARGVDTFAGTWAAARGVPVRVYPADWKKHGRGAGPIRNKQMLVEGKPDVVIAFPGGAGTANMIMQATSMNVPVEY
jgi:hypothetical protein